MRHVLAIQLCNQLLASIARLWLVGEVTHIQNAAIAETEVVVAPCAKVAGVGRTGDTAQEDDGIVREERV